MTIENDLSIILEFSEDRPNSLIRKNKKLLAFSVNQSKKYSYGSPEHVEKLREQLEKGRKKLFKNPATHSDNAVYEFLKVKKSYTNEIIKNVIKYHYDAMGAENIIGHYLEEFINENKGKENWIWCSGSVIDKIDFIQKINANKNVTWKALQVKASSNTENSSSSEVRENTEILFWCRRNATKKNSQNWEELREFISNDNLNEENFLEFLRSKAKI